MVELLWLRKIAPLERQSRHTFGGILRLRSHGGSLKSGFRGYAAAAALREAPAPEQQPSPPPPTSTTFKSQRLAAVENTKPFSSFLTDKFSRQHDYLRISITERCNLRCLYCMPEEGVPLSPKKHLLTHHEILYLSSLFVSQGVTKIRLTGGEPTIHPQILPMLRDIGSLRPHGLREIALTTNGLTLTRKLDSMVESGVTGINLSLDTLDPFQFEIMTRRRGFDQVMKSIDRILEMKQAGVPMKLKINAVVIRGLNDAQILPFVDLTREKDVEVRFIEYMPFDGNRWSSQKMLSFQEMLAVIQEHHPSIRKIEDHPNDTSKTYKVPGYKGRIGFITSMTENFCGSCNRLRITSDGNLKVCLFGNAEVSLRDLLRDSYNNGQPIDQEAWEAMKQIEMDRREGRTSTETLGAQEKELQLLDTIGMAVKRKKEKHAGIGQLEHMKNRPMILIDALSKPPSPVPHAFTPTRSTRTSLLPPTAPSTLPLHLLARTQPSTAHSLSRPYSSTSKPAAPPAPDTHLTHLTPSSTVRMVTLPPSKATTARLATATATLVFSDPATYEVLRTASLKKGDALAVSRVAGIAGAKLTSSLIPLCHNIPLSGVDVEVSLVAPRSGEGSADGGRVGGEGREYGCLEVRATAKTNGQTGVEMEALVAASTAALTAYDMCKAVDKGMKIEAVRVVRKEGGQSGDWVDGLQVRKGP